ncbi:hypothetical protein CO033_00195 [Candidatus Nomurabacteria bacterium CG_4_9_14_0_2_um_filter_32_10]|uniref:Type II secretion system protein GspG C-terminal domain-containing protein n=3 Tax=Candidatus Nomuraibacteriota TaxID=1752729 RepID=A0A2H0CGQ1_9BACT|nr:MAG: hypothetical protein COW91_01935 [Candidatus Nomurabacteria bacterium CG22_combo_CG10-13_8_21_14_all_32_8]PIZ85971.1 MAG: hypothetical protein COX94_01490 [Candidatus Nomurabacteria bacterium CG_4_10_14_0_2_um_filter_33_9]PJC49689.1 MAG: hypothetical protein CO033_00195 [Candidatus Nomurabacteria bacterium CG_4_9_14_0_2_um_filter_32_10]
MILSKKKGFTLIELLVVVAIIGILASIVLISLNNARSKARNAKRNSDIEQIIIVLNLDFDNRPIPNRQWYCISQTCSGGFKNQPRHSQIDAYLKQYIPNIIDPEDNKRGYGGYVYAKTGPWPSSPYDGTFFEYGVYLNYILEPTTLTSISCGKGKIFKVTSNYIQCLFKVD